MTGNRRVYPCEENGCGKVLSLPQQLTTHLMNHHNYTKSDAKKKAYKNFDGNSNSNNNIQNQTGANMTQNQNETPINQKVGAINEGELPELIGTIKRTLSEASNLSDELQGELFPQRQALTHFLKRLQLKSLTEEDFIKIREEYTDIYETKFKKHLDKKKRVYGIPASASVDMDIEFRKSQIQSKLRGLLVTINKSPKKDHLAEEQEKIGHLLNQLSSDALNKSLITQIENQFNDQVKPIIDAVLGDSKRGSSSGDFDDILERSLEELEREYKLNRLNNQLLEQKMYQKQLLTGGVGGGSSAPMNMVPTSRPILDENGEPKRDSKGQILYEQTYQAPGSPDFGVYHVLASALRRPESDHMTPILVAMMENQQANQNNMNQMFLAMMNNNNSGDNEKLFLQMQSDNKDTMMEIMKHQSDQQNAMNIELARIRAEADSSKDKMVEFQMDTMRREMEELKQMAYANPIERMLTQKQQLQQLGLVTDSRSASVDEKAVEEMGKMVNGIGNKMDNMAGNFVKLIQPIAEAQGEILRDRNKLQAPPTYSDEKKKVMLQQMIQNLEARNQAAQQQPYPIQQQPRLKQKQVIVTD